LEDPEVPIPWPKYATMEDPMEVADFAKRSGLTGLALSYEKRYLNRPEFIAALEGSVEELVAQS